MLPLKTKTTLHGEVREIMGNIQSQKQHHQLPKKKQQNTWENDCHSPGEKREKTFDYKN